MKDSVRSLTRASLSSAAGVAILYLGSLLPSARLAVLCLSTLGVVFVATTCPTPWAWGCYLVTGAAALLLLPEKMPAVVYLAFFGYYPLLKLRLERVGNPWFRWVLKLAAFNLAVGALYLVYRAAFSGLVRAELPLWVLWPAGNAAFAAYDFALGQLILYYLRNLAGRIK